jgi:hypothetical protein
MPTIPKDETADIQGKAGRRTYRYTDINTLLDAVLPVLRANDIAVTQSTAVLPTGQFVLRTTLWHTEGDGTIEGEYLIQAVNMGDPQAVGSAVTYARRYALIALLCLSAEDDDGEKAGAPPPPPEPPIRQSPPPKFESWQTAVSNALMASDEETMKAMLGTLAQEALGWGDYKYLAELRDRVDSQKFRTWLESEALKRGVQM